MANHIEDQFAFLINDSIYSSSQQHLLLRANFARQNEGDSGNLGGVGNEIEFGNLGFGGEIDATEVLLEGGVKVNMVRPLRCVALDGGGELGFDRGEKGVEFVENGVFECLEDGERLVEVGGVCDVVSEGVGDGERRVEVEGVGNVVIEGVEETGNCVEVEDVGNVVIEAVEESGKYVRFEGVENGVIKGVEVEGVEEAVNCVEDGEYCVEVGGVENVDETGNCVELEGVNYVETEVIEVDEEGVNCERVDEGMSKDGEIGNVDTEVIEVVEEGDNRVEVEGGDYMETEVIDGDEEGGNCEKVDGRMSNVDTEVFEVVEEEENCVVVEGVGNVDIEVVDVDEKGGNCEKIDSRTSNDEEMIDLIGDDTGGNHAKVDDICDLDDGFIGFGNVDIEVVDVDEKGGNCEQVDRKTSKDEEMINLIGDDAGGNPAKVDDICDLEDGFIGFEKVSEIFKKGDCAKVDGETSKVVMEEIVVEEEVNKTSTKDDEDASRKLPSEDASREENTSINKEQVTRKKRKLPRSMFEQWGSELGNGESCSKGESSKENGSEKSLDGEAYRCILDALKFLVEEKSYDGKEGDFFETAKRRGMTFPRPRFRRAGIDDDM